MLLIFWPDLCLFIVPLLIISARMPSIFVGTYGLLLVFVVLNFYRCQRHSFLSSKVALRKNEWLRHVSSWRDMWGQLPYLGMKHWDCTCIPRTWRFNLYKMDFWAKPSRMLRIETARRARTCYHWPLSFWRYAGPLSKSFTANEILKNVQEVLQRHILSNKLHTRRESHAVDM